MPEAMEVPISPAIMGTISSPDSAAEVPEDICRNVGTNPIAANIPMPSVSPIAVALRNAGLRNRWSGVMGSSAGAAAIWYPYRAFPFDRVLACCARSYVVVDYALRAGMAAEGCAVTPGIESPTVSPLHDQGWVAVRAMVPKREVHRIMDELYDMGARGILVTDRGLEFRCEVEEGLGRLPRLGAPYGGQRVRPGDHPRRSTDGWPPAAPRGSPVARHRRRRLAVRS